MVKYNKPAIDWKTQRKSVAIPDQSLSIQEIVKRFVRGVPVDITQRQPVYVDQNEHDLEKLSRMDFGEKAEYASNLRERAAEMRTDIEDRQRSHALAQAQEQQEFADEAALRSRKVKKRQPLDDQDGVK